MDKIEKVLKEISKQKLPAFFSSDIYDILYLTEIKVSSGFLILTQNKIIFLTDGRYKEYAESLKEIEFIEYKGKESILKVIKENNIKEICFDPNKEKANIKKFLDCSILEKEYFFDNIRKIKTLEEIVKISQAVKITKDTLKELESKIFELTEYEIRCEIIKKYYQKGAIGEGFETIVAADKNASIPHYHTSFNKSSYLCLIDTGCRYKNYVSDLTRTYFKKHAPFEIKKIYELVKETQEKVINLIKPGIKVKDLDNFVREIFKKHGYEEFYLHSLGHGIGVYVHELPRISYKSEEVLQENMIITIEPGIYIKDLGGVRLEEDILVTKNGGIIL